MSDGDRQLELTGLRRRFGDTITLGGLSFTVPRGQVFGFLGSRLKAWQVLRSAPRPLW